VASYCNPKLALAELPALSVHVPPTEAELLSGPEYEPDVQEAIPLAASEPLKATPTGWLYQPFASAPREGVALAEGGVESYESVTDFGAETLPATSVHVAFTEAELESGPEYDGALHEAIPEVPSVPEAVAPTAWLYQPFESGALCRETESTVGLVVSTLKKIAGLEALPSLPPSTLQLTLWCVPSPNVNVPW
jgi:hypothetical protein